jgi:hypothetical protein
MAMVILLKKLLKFYSKVWFNTLEPKVRRTKGSTKLRFALAAVQTTYCFQKPGIKPDGIINFLSNEPPIGKLLYVPDTVELCSAEAHFSPP